MKYQTYKPSKDLSDIVKCYWTLDGAKEDIPEKQTIVPDGCMEMIFHYGDRYRQYFDDGKTVLQPTCFVVGQLTKPFVIAPTGTTGIFSIRFHPNGFFPFATIPLKKMENKAVQLKRIFGDNAIHIEKQILQRNTARERVKRAEKFLLSQLTGQDAVDRIVKTTVDTILSAYGQLSIQELSRQTKTNRRQLERKFSATIGLSPKQLSKTVRLQSTLQLLLDNKFTSLTALSYENEYYDQAHFIKDFKEFTGVTPKEFYKDNLKMSALFYGSR